MDGTSRVVRENHQDMKTGIPFLALALVFGPIVADVQAQCEADHTIVMADYYFAPSELTIAPGETVAFVNVQGNHNVNGVTNTQTGEPWGNPVEFFLDETEGTEEGTCMGVVTFDVPGVYNFDSSLGFQAQLGMVGSITVDAFTLYDLTFQWTGDETAPQAWQSTWAMNSYCPEIMNGNDPHTVFLVSDAGVEALGDFMNLNQFDLLGMPDMQEILYYHTVPGIVMAENLVDGLSLPTVQGQEVTFAEGPNGWTINGVNIIDTDHTAFNGVIHIIDYGLAPEGLPQATVFEVVAQSPSHNLFEEALIDNFLNDDLIGQIILNDNEPAPGPFTVFAPTDAAWYTFAIENGFDGGVEELFASQYMEDILRRHIVQAPYESGDFFNGQNVNTYGGGNIQMSVNGGSISAANALVTIPDLMAYNGVVHVVNEVIDFNFPAPVGTCGGWTVELYNQDTYDGWGDTQVDIFINGELAYEASTNEVALDTNGDYFPDVLGMSTFAFAVDDGDVIDFVFDYNYPGGYQAGYVVKDQNGDELFSSFSTNQDDPASVFGLQVCGAEPTCGLIEIEFIDQAQEGWIGGSMLVQQSDGPSTAINFGDFTYFESIYPFYQFRAFVPVNAGELDFFVGAPFYFGEYCGYRVYSPQGQLLVNDVNDFAPPANALDVAVCGGIPSSVEGMEDGPLVLSVYPNPARDRVFLEGIAPGKAWTAALVGLDGRTMARFNGVGASPIDLPLLAAGLYTLNVTVEGTPHALRLAID